MKITQPTLFKFTRQNIIFFGVLGVIAVGLLGMGLYNTRAAADITHSMKLADSAALESHMLVGGDVFWGRRMNDWSQQSSLKEKYPFSRLHEFEREKYDAWIANFECPSVPGVKHPIGYVPQLWEFNCDADYLPEFAKWFDIVSLANNHTSNQKREIGQEATRKALDAQGIQHFGGFNPHKKEDVCAVVGLPARAKIDGQQQSISIPIAMCGYHGVYYTITDEAMAEMQHYAKYMPVIAMPHMGREYQATADEKREKLYRSMIDNGADVVLGNHPHWVQPTEAYKGKLIAYSMGNLIFDQEFSPDVMRSAMFDITMSVDEKATSPEIVKAWAELGKQCVRTGDNCLEQAKAQNLAKLPTSLKYDIVGVDLSSRITHKANQRLKDEILTRLNWQQVSSQLK